MQTAVTTMRHGPVVMPMAAASATQASSPSGALVVRATRAAPSIAAPPATMVVPDGHSARSGPFTDSVLVAVRALTTLTSRR